MNIKNLTQEKEESIRLFAPGSIIRMLARSYVVKPREPAQRGKTARFEIGRGKTARFENDETFANVAESLKETKLSRIWVHERYLGKVERDLEKVAG